MRYSSQRLAKQIAICYMTANIGFFELFGGAFGADGVQKVASSNLVAPNETLSPSPPRRARAYLIAAAQFSIAPPGSKRSRKKRGYEGGATGLLNFSR